MKLTSTLPRAAAIGRHAVESASRTRRYSTLEGALPSSSTMFARPPAARLHVAVLPTALPHGIRGHIQLQLSDDEARKLLRQLQDNERKEIAGRLSDAPWSPLSHYPDEQPPSSEPVMAIGHSPKRGPTEAEPRRWTMRSREGIEYPVKQVPSTKIEGLSAGEGLANINLGKLSSFQARLLATVITNYAGKDYSLSGRLPIPQAHWLPEERARFEAHGEAPAGAPNCADFMKDVFAEFGSSMGPKEPGLQQFLTDLYAAPRPQEVMDVVSKYFFADDLGFMNFKAPLPA